MTELFHTYLYVPIYNLLVYLAGAFPGADVGLAVVVVTLVVKIILLPVSWSMARTQKKMQVLQPKLKELQERHKDDKEAHARATMALYKEHGVNPFGSILVLIIQLPILLALYSVVRAHLFVGVDATLLYPFVHAPATLSPLFLGVFDIASASIPLAVLAAVSQLLFGWFGTPAPVKPAPGAAPSMADDMARMTALQVRYFFPVLIGIISYAGGGAIALYFLTSNLFSLGQQLLVNKLHAAPAPTA